MHVIFTLSQLNTTNFSSIVQRFIFRCVFSSWFRPQRQLWLNGPALLHLVLIFFKDELPHILHPYSFVLWNVNESRFHKMMPNIRPQFKTIKHTVEMYNTNFSHNDKFKLHECISTENLFPVSTIKSMSMMHILKSLSLPILSL